MIRTDIGERNSKLGPTGPNFTSSHSAEPSAHRRHSTHSANAHSPLRSSAGPKVCTVTLSAASRLHSPCTRILSAPELAALQLLSPEGGFCTQDTLKISMHFGIRVRDQRPATGSLKHSRDPLERPSRVFDDTSSGQPKDPNVWLGSGGRLSSWYFL